MVNILKLSLLFILISSFASAQQTTFQDSLLNRFVGSWVLQGSIAETETTHDITAQWVLGHQYLQFHEISREKNANDEAVYEAIVHIGWDKPAGRYACLWLDVTGGGGLSAEGIGHGQRNGDTIAFVFAGSDGSLFHTTFVYHRSADVWEWRMDGEVNGKLEPFARVKLTKKI